MNAINNVESFKDAFSTMMKRMKKMKHTSEFMQIDGAQDDENKFLVVNGTKIYYNDASLSDIINLNLRKKMF